MSNKPNERERPPIHVFTIKIEGHGELRDVQDAVERTVADCVLYEPFILSAKSKHEHSYTPNKNKRFALDEG